MSDNESSIYHVNKNLGMQPKSAETTLITLERVQKLDLLIHLISNLRQSLVICGPIGIGKTVLLNELRACKKDVWPMVNIEGSSNSSFESIQGQLFKFLTQHYAEYKNQGLSSILSALNSQNQKIVIIIDDAGRLVPGLITTLIQYAADITCLRVVFALTHDELHIKSSSDSAIDECHFIEIPPLSEKQCAVFLQNLSAQPGAIVPFNAISERLVEKLYRETHGLPGKIISELPNLSNYSATVGYKWGGATFLLIMVVSAIGISWLISDDSDLQANKAMIDAHVMLKEAEEVEISSPLVNSDIDTQISEASNELLNKHNSIPAPPRAKIEVNSSFVVPDAEKVNVEIDGQQLQQLQKPIAVKTAGLDNEHVTIDEKKNRAVIDKTPVKQAPVAKKVIEKKKVTKKIKTLVTKKVDKVIVATPQVDAPVGKKDDRLWVLAQAGNNYTIQLIVLSKRVAVVEFSKKHQKLKENLRFFQMSKQGQEKYAVIYGSFKNKEIASNKMKSLPAKYRKSWVRSFSNLQKIINN